MSEQEPRALVGAYYFDGWAGKCRHDGDPDKPWAKGGPTHLTKRLVHEFPEREPVWGWRDDSAAIMEQQIDLAADHGVGWFAFCWYWHDDGGPLNRQAIADDPKHTSMELFLAAPNCHRMEFCLLVANHGGFAITGTAAWREAADFWMPYLTHPQHLTVDGKPLVINFNARGGDADGFAYLQEAARAAGLPGVAIAACGGADDAELRAMGYTHRTHYNTTMGYTAGLEEHHFSELVEHSEKQWRGSAELPYIPVLTAGWDCRPWEGPDGLGGKQPGWYFPDRTPEQLAAFVEDGIAWLDAHPEVTPKERLLLLYAWNEFGEGGWLAPTKGDPDGAYLEAIDAVVRPG